MPYRLTTLFSSPPSPFLLHPLSPSPYHVLYRFLRKCPQALRQQRSISSRSNGHSSNVVAVAVDSGAAASLPSFLRESPMDTTVARGVKRAYSSLDRLSWRIGTTLRRYPMARIFVIAYMVSDVCELECWGRPGKSPEGRTFSPSTESGHRERRPRFQPSTKLAEAE